MTMSSSCLCPFIKITVYLIFRHKRFGGEGGQGWEDFPKSLPGVQLKAVHGEGSSEAKDARGPARVNK